MEQHTHIVNTLGARFGIMQMALSLGHKKEADKIHADAIKWFKGNYEVTRITKDVPK